MERRGFHCRALDPEKCTKSYGNSFSSPYSLDLTSRPPPCMAPLTDMYSFVRKAIRCSIQMNSWIESQSCPGLRPINNCFLNRDTQASETSAIASVVILNSARFFGYGPPSPCAEMAKSENLVWRSTEDIYSNPAAGQTWRWSSPVFGSSAATGSPKKSEHVTVDAEIRKASKVPDQR